MLICYNESGEKVFEHLTKAVYRILNLGGKAVVELIFADAEDIREVNRATRGIDKPTDVLSFPMLNEIKPFTGKNYPADYDPELKAVVLGSIMICREIAVMQAEEYGHSVEREESYLLVHGLLHLLGYDHESETDKKVMRDLEEQVLNKIKR